MVPHFHLPLQSGSDRLLRRMNRQYTRDDFLRMLDLVKSGFDRPALTTDVIVGFPGETDEEFERTVEVVDRAHFIHVHAFSPPEFVEFVRFFDPPGENLEDKLRWVMVRLKEAGSS